MLPDGIRDLAIPDGGVHLDAEPHAVVLGRMPIVAACSLGSTLVCSVVLVSGGAARARIVLAAAAEMAVLASMPATLRSARRASATLRIAAGCCVLLGWIAVALLFWTPGHREILAVRLLTLYSFAAFLFAWGWGIEAM